jgi:hypothetical protein
VTPAAPDDHTRLKPSGGKFLSDPGVNVDAAIASKRPTGRPCLDWTKRRQHPADALGAELFDTMLWHGWIRRRPQPRSIQVTKKGATEFARHFTR